jgi:thiamine biosynthesis protein ThiS
VSDSQQSIIINGEPREIPGPLTIAELLRHLSVSTPHVAVERNRSIVAKQDFDRIRLEPGDRLEIVTLVGGG